VQPLTSGLVIHGVRIRDTYADGVNLNEATSNSTVEQSSFRNTGDDSLATWSYAADGPTPCTGNVFQQNTVQAVWRANCFALYGGTDNSVVSNTCADTSNYAGIFIATTGGFDVIPFSGTTVVQHDTLTRAGGWHAQYDYNGMGALKFFADGKPIAATIQVSDLQVDHAVLSAIQFSGNQSVSGVTFDSVQVSGYTTSGIVVDSGANGSAQLTNVGVGGGPAPGLKNDSATTFSLTRGAGNLGW
jgi:hypothetical protein